SSGTFRDLELGLTEGETEGRLKHMQEAVMALHGQSEELGRRLQGFRPAFFSFLGSLNTTKELEHDVKDLHHRVQRYLHDLSRITQSVKQSNQQFRQLEDRLNRAKEQVGQLEQETGYPLDRLKDQ